MTTYAPLIGGLAQGAGAILAASRRPPNITRAGGPNIQLQDPNSSASSYANRFLSDVRSKESLHAGQRNLHEMLDHANPYQFKYKPGISEANPDLAPPGSHVGLIAQDLEQSQLGSRLVKRDQNGTKSIDLKESVPVLLAAVTDLHKRLNSLEGKK